MKQIFLVDDYGGRRKTLKAISCGACGSKLVFLEKSKRNSPWRVQYIPGRILVKGLPHCKVCDGKIDLERLKRLVHALEGEYSPSPKWRIGGKEK